MGMPDITISGEKLFGLFGFDITNTFLLSLIIEILIFAVFYFVFKNRKFIPSRLQNFAEWILESIFNFIDSITRDRKKTKEIFPIAATLFILILFCNYVELLPGLGVFHFLRAPTSDLNLTLGLALFSIIFINILSLKRLGFFTYSKRFLNFKNPILFFVGILEGISEITKCFSLAFRLFGNIFAGEVLLIISSFLIAYFVPLPFLALEIIVGFIQALIFSSLVVIFYTSATEHSQQQKVANSRSQDLGEK
ncbi:F0F1 ATP synthase subunit A [bacterium]|nr:F0F1 ATP synthase subunit A [bacterium]